MSGGWGAGAVPLVFWLAGEGLQGGMLPSPRLLQPRDVQGCVMLNPSLCILLKLEVRLKADLEMCCDCKEGCGKSRWVLLCLENANDKVKVEKLLWKQKPCLGI